MLYRFSDRLWYTQAEEATDRPVLGYLRGDRLALMIDAGNSSRHARQVLALLEGEGLPHPDLVALTHSHWDHCYGLCARDAVSICCAATRKDLERDASLVWSDDAMHTYLETGVVQKFCEEHMRVEYPRLEEKNFSRFFAGWGLGVRGSGIYALLDLVFAAVCHRQICLFGQPCYL